MKLKQSYPLTFKPLNFTVINDAEIERRVLVALDFYLRFLNLEMEASK